MDNTDRGGHVIPEEDFAKAISECRKDPCMDALFTHAPQGAKLFIGLLFYTQYFGENIDEEQYQAAFMDVETSLTPNDIDYLLRNDIDTETKDYLRGLLVQKEVADISVARSVKLKPVRLQREMETLPAKNTRQSEFEQMVATEKRRRRVDMLLSLLKNAILLGIVAAVGYGVWLVFKGDAPLEPENSREDTSSHVVGIAKTAKEVIPKSKPSGGRQKDSTQVKETPKLDFNAIKNSVVVIGNEGKEGGTAFILKMEGKNYLVTNDHVAQMTDHLRRVYLLDGTPITLGAFEVATDRDMVRFEVDDSLPSLELDQSLPEMGGKIVIYGNSMGRGAVTEEKGTIKAIGPMRLEVDAKVVPGNSGSPVLDMTGKVIGILTYGTNDTDEKDWQTKNTRYADVRRWAVRFSAVKWNKVEWGAYVRQTEIMNDLQNFRARLDPFIAVRQEDTKANRSSYGLRYDELTKRMFQAEDKRLRVHLIGLSKMNGEWDKARREFKQVLDNRNSSESVVEEQRKKYQKATFNFDSGIYQSLGTILEGVTNTVWVSFKLRETSIVVASRAEQEMEIWQTAMRDNEEEQKELKDAVEKAFKETDPVKALFEKKRDCIVIVKTGMGHGSGFLVRMDGKIWFVTNEHVASGGNPLSVKTVDGKDIKLEPVIEVASDRDLVRMPVTGCSNALDIADCKKTKDQVVYIYGNSEGEEVATFLNGKITGVGPAKIETDCGFVGGNSGSAILTDDGKVLGVATYLKRPDKENPYKQGTKFANNVRRFGVTFDKAKWEKTSWNIYCSNVQALNDCKWYADFCDIVCSSGKSISLENLEREFKTYNIKSQQLKMAARAIARADDRWREHNMEIERLTHEYKNVYSKDRKVTETYGDWLSTISVTYTISDWDGSIKGSMVSDRLHRLIERRPSIFRDCFTVRLSAIGSGSSFAKSLMKSFSLTRLRSGDRYEHGSAIEFEVFFPNRLAEFKTKYNKQLATPNTGVESDKTRKERYKRKL